MRNLQHGGTIMRTATTPIVAEKPTVTECSHAERQEIIARTEAGESTATIAAALERNERTITRWRSAYRRQGEEGLAYHSRRPPQPPPHTTPPDVVDRIRAIRTAHPGWGARLIRRQLLLDGVSPLPCERTVQHWLHRLGFGPVRTPHKPLGFPQPPRATDRDDTLWEVDHKKKGGASP
jgi:transposase